MDRVQASVKEQEQSRLRERLNTEQAHLDLPSGLDRDTLFRRVVGELALHSGLERAYLLDAGGTVQASLSPGDMGQPIGAVLAHAGDASTALRELATRSLGGNAIDVAWHGQAPLLTGLVPTRSGDRLLVVVDASRPLALRRAAVRRELMREAGLLLAVVALLAWGLHLAWFRRAERLAKALGEMGAGHLSVRTGLSGRDELALIGAQADRMAERLQADQARLLKMTQVVDRSPLVVIEWRNAPGWPVAYVSDSLRQWAHEPADLTGGRVLFNDLFHPDDAERVNAEIAHYFAHGPDEYRQEYRLRRGDGHWVWVDDRSRLERDASGEVTHISGILLDITVQKEALLAQDEQAQMLRLFYELPFIGMAISSPVDKRWLHVNDRLCEILGHSREELLRTPWTHTTHPDDLAPNLTLFDDLLAGRIDSYQLQKRFLRKDGSTVATELNVRPVRNPDGSIRHLFTTIQDITERLRASAELNEHKDRLEQRVAQRTAELSEANHELEAFSYTVSHDLRAPLRGIDGYSQLLQEEHGPRLGEEGRHFVERIRAGVMQMSELISDLLDYSHLDRRAMEHDPVAVQPLIERVLAMYAPDIERHGIEVVQTIEPLTLQLDGEALKLALRNLIGNALKFGRGGSLSRIEIGARRQGDRCLIWVRDHGVGFDMQYHDRIFGIFGIFQRLHRAEDYPGTGVGLALVSKAVQRMGGRVWAYSELGKGATFHLEFPA